MENLEHKGIILHIEGRTVEVQMTVEGACASCKVKSVCGVGESQDKIVTVLTDLASYYKPGEEVRVSVTKMMGIKAVVYAYIFPFFLMLFTLLVLLELNASETIAGLSALGAVAFYYIILFFMRKKLERVIVFKINKI